VLPTIRCGICQRFFRPYHHNTKYCPKCRGTKNYYRPVSIALIVCGTCGIEIETGRKNQKYCSDRCRYAHHANKSLSTQECPECKDMFDTTNSQKVYCTSGCRILAKKQRQREKRDGILS